jgi:hypothetical protein
MHLSCWFPRVVRMWVSLPLEEILQGFLSPVEAVINDGLDLILVFSLDQFGGWSDIVRSVLRSLVVCREETGVEHVVDLPGVG